MKSSNPSIYPWADLRFRKEHCLVWAAVCTVFVMTSFVCCPLAYAIVATVENPMTAEEDGSVIEVTNVKGKGVPVNLRVLVMPGEKKQLSRRNVFSFIVNRVYADYKERFQVLCPEDPRMKEAVTLTLTELRTDKVGGGCVVARKGKWTSTGGAVWEKKQMRYPELQ